MSQNSRTNKMAETGFNWKKVSIKTHAFDGTHRSGAQTLQQPANVMTSAETFECQPEASVDEDGQPTVEKTIFIVKPVYIPVHIAADKEISGQKIRNLKNK